MAKLSPEKWTNLSTPQVQQENLDFISENTPSAPDQQPAMEMPEGLNEFDPPADPGSVDAIQGIINEINDGFPPGLQDPYVDPTEETHDWANADGNLVVPGGSAVGDSNLYGN